MNIVQNTWNEADDQDLLDYLKNDMIIFNKNALLDLDISILSNFSCVYADTSIIQKILKCTIPDTYPTKLKDFYGRNIDIIDVSSIYTLKNKFVKPIGNSKAFEASIIRNHHDIEQLISEIKENKYNEKSVYVSDLVEFVNEYRIFFANGTYDIVESSEYLISSFKIISAPPPVDFLTQLFNNEIFRSHPYNICIVDVGMLKDGRWVVVEVNPPFSITSYNYNIEKYCNYCSLAWREYINYC